MSEGTTEGMASKSLMVNQIMLLMMLQEVQRMAWLTVKQKALWMQLLKLQKEQQIVGYSRGYCRWLH